MKNAYRECGDVTEVYCSHKNGTESFFLIDTADLPLVMQAGTWTMRGDKRQNSQYVHARDWRPFMDGRQIVLHRFLTKCPAGLVVDHINGNGLDNRRRNLRCVTQKENLANRKPWEHMEGVFHPAKPLEPISA